VIVMCVVGTLRSPSPCTANCLGQNLKENPGDPTAYGPYAVSRKTLHGGFGAADRNLTVEVWFPADAVTPGATTCHWDIKDSLPAEQAQKIPDTPCSDSGPSKGVCCNPTLGPKAGYEHCHNDLDLAAAGVFPVMVFVHGTGGWRTNSATIIHKWVSRGWVVFAIDYPGIWLRDLVQLATNPFLPTPRTDQEGDTRDFLKQLAAMEDPRLQFLKGRIETRRSRRAIAGHSAGGFVASRLSAEFGTVIPMAAAGVEQWDRFSPAASALVLGAVNDTIVPDERQIDGYGTSETPKRLVLFNNTGHQFCSDLCWIGSAQGGIIETAKACNILIAGVLGFLATDGCQFVNPSFAPVEQGWRIIDAYSNAVLEETARCDNRMTLVIPFLESRLNGENAGAVAAFEQQLIGRDHAFEY